MTKEEVKKFKELCEQFEEDCSRVASILSQFEVYNKSEENITFASRFLPNGKDEVYWHGDEYWRYGGHEEHEGYFPIKYLSMTDEQVRKAGARKNAEFLKKKKEKEDAIAAEKKRKEYEQYQKLKEQFENK